MIDSNKLRRLAQAATPGPWVSQGRYIGTPRHMSYIGEVRDQCGNWSDTEKSRADSAFIAAANPAAISELLDRLEAAERSLDCCRSERKEAAELFLSVKTKLIAERDGLRQCFNVWIDKTEWVQRGIDEGTISPKYLGLHRADVMASLLGAAEKERDKLRALVDILRSEISELLEAAESARRDDYQNWMTALDRNAELLAKLESAEKELAELRSSMKFRTSLIGRTEAERDKLRAKIAEMEKQEPFDADSDVFRGAFDAALKAGNWPATRQGDGYRSPSTQIAWRITFSTVNRLKLYALPGALPAPSVPREAIEKMLTQLMDIAVSNGANSVSMPDEYVEVAAWLCGIPAQPAPSAPDGWKLVPIEPTPMMKTAGIGVEVYQDSPPSSDCLTWEEAEAIYTAMLAAAPEAKP